MGILSKSLGINALSLEDPSVPLLPMSAMTESLGLGRSDAGVLVNERQALRTSAVFACFKVISEDLSKIPLSVYQTLPDGSIRFAPEHPVHKLIHDQPNPIMTATSFRGAFITSALAFGNAFAMIQRDKAARPVALHPLPSDKTSAIFVDGNFGFATTATTDGRAKWIDPENVLHLLGLSLDGIHGFSPVTTCKNAVGITIAAEKFNAQFFGNGARATGVLSHPAHLDPEAYENLKKSVREWATGDNALRPIILEEGLKWDQITVNPNDGQVIQVRKFQVQEIARLYRVTLHKLIELERATNNNVEHMAIEHNQDALQPWAVKLEQEINRKLLGGTYFAEHDFSELTRGDSVSQANAVTSLRNNGLITTNDGRRRLRMNPITHEEGGDIVIVQGANIPLSSLVNFSAVGSESSAQQEADSQLGELGGDKNAEYRPHIVASYRRLFRDAVGRIANRGNDQQFAQKALQPIVASMLEAINVTKHGNATLNDDDDRRVRDTVLMLASHSTNWTRDNAAETAVHVTTWTYSVLAA